MDLTWREQWGRREGRRREDGRIWKAGYGGGNQGAPPLTPLHCFVSPGEIHAQLFPSDLGDVKPKTRLKWNTVNPGHDEELN